MSRRGRPKHLLSLFSTASLLQETIQRVAPLVPLERIIVITGSDHESEVRRQLNALAAESVIAEPMRRDTAPCVGLGAQLSLQMDADATMLVVPADHLITPAAEFCRTVEYAVQLVDESPQRLVTIGITPDRPATGYGYIERGTPLKAQGCRPAFDVKRFREKPDIESARKYLQSGEYYWNSGIFIWSARTILSEIRRTQPALFDALERIGQAWRTPDFGRVLRTEYEQINGISIDYAVLESAASVVVIESGFLWDDIGSWGAVERFQGTAGGSNTVRGLHCGIDTEDSIVLTDPDHLVATVGVNNLIVVQCGKATLVADKRREESVKQLVEQLRQRGLEDFL
jgi:mannose-1-phosphate guanylyltransferase